MSQKPRAHWRDRLYEIIFEADTRAGQWFDIVLLLVILVSVSAVCLETVESINAQYGQWITFIEWTTTGLFTIEYILRLISARRPLAYTISFYGVVDLLSILPTYLGLLGVGRNSFAVIRSFRLLRVFRIMKLFHLTSESEDLGRAVWQARSKIVVFLSVVLITVTIAGTAMYEVERLHDIEETQFTSIPQSIYWAVVTMTTVGYGDVVPKTTLGKILSTLVILVGYSLIIVPTGFVSAEILDSKKSKMKSTQTCSYCFAEGHLFDATFCRKCGKAL